jgi:hypothetical protein
MTGFSFAMDQPLRSARLTGSGLPAESCTLGPGLRFIDCTETTVDVNVTWAGQGQINRGAFSTTDRFDQLLLSSSISGALRQATATGTIAGSALPTTQQAFLFRSADTELSVCTGQNC